jgi:hypothetical protein
MLMEAKGILRGRGVLAASYTAVLTGQVQLFQPRRKLIA